MSASYRDPYRRLTRGLLPWAAALFLTLAAIYAFSVDIRATRGASITADEPFYLLTTQSLLHDGDLDLRNQYLTRSYEDFFDHDDDLWVQSVPADDGRVLSPHNPGLSVFVLPAFALGGLVGVQVQLMLVAAAAMTLAFVLADRLTGQRTASLLVTLGVGAGAVAFVHSTEVYPEFPAAMALVVSLLVITARPRPGLREAVWVAVLLSAMCWLGVKYTPLAVLVAGYFLLRADGQGRTALVALGAASAGVFAWFHLHSYGGLTPYAVNLFYAGQSTVELLGGHVEFGDRVYRLWGLFVDQRFGIGRWTPLLLVVVPGLVLLARAGLPQRLVLGLIVVQVLIATFVALTMMGWWFAGRTLITVLPMMVLPVTMVVAAVPARVRAAIGALAAYGVLVTAGLAYAAHTGQITIAVDPFDMRFPPFQGVSWLFPNYQSWTWETQALTVLWLVVGAVSLRAAARLTSDPVPAAQPARGAASEARSKMRHGRQARTSQGRAHRAGVNAD